MGKNDFLTPKAIGNRIKSKGLQKLRWFCQMCQKQCRDENGFKCHLNSESHRRQMEIFGQNADRVVAGYSEEFENDFLTLMRQSHPRTRVAAKNVYNEFIADKYHIHMNSTKWYTLTEFVKYLGKTGCVNFQALCAGKCRVDETSKGWFISLIQADPLEEIEKGKKVKRDRAEKDEEDRKKHDIEAQIERARKVARIESAEDDTPQASELKRDETDQPLKISLAASNPDKPSSKAPPVPKFDGTFAEDSRSAQLQHQQAPTRPRSKLEELMQREKAMEKQKTQRAAAAAAAAGSTARKDEAWLVPGIIVKVMSKALKEAGYYKGKGAVEKVLKQYVAQISMLDGGDVLQVDQAELETVLPQEGGTVIVLQEPHRGSPATMMGIDTAAYKANVRLQAGKQAVLSLPYEGICKAVSGR